MLENKKSFTAMSVIVTAVVLLIVLVVILVIFQNQTSKTTTALNSCETRGGECENPLDNDCPEGGKKTLFGECHGAKICCVKLDTT